MNATRDTTGPTFDATVTRHDTTGNATAGELVTITEAAQKLSVSVRTVQRRLDNGDLEYTLDHKYKRLVKLPLEVLEAIKEPEPDATGNATPDTTERDSDATPRDTNATPTGADDTRLGRLEGYQMAQFEQRLQAGIAQAVQLATAPLLEMLKEQRDEMSTLRAQLDRLEAGASAQESETKAGPKLGQVRTEITEHNGTETSTPGAPGEEPIEAAQGVQSTPGIQTHAAAKQTAQRGAMARKLRPWQRAIMRVIGARE